MAVSKTLREYLESDDKSDRNFIETLKTTCLSELQKPEKEYTLLTSISLSNDTLKDFSVQLMDCRIRFHVHIPSHLSGRNKVLLKQGSSMAEGEMPDDYTIVTVEIRSRYCKEAIERGLEALDVIRGLINMDVNASDLIFGDEWQPVNKVTYGKIHTLHDNVGCVLLSPVYFEPNFVERIPLNNSKADLLKKNMIHRLTKIEEIQFRQQILGAMVRFTRALDEPDKNVAIIKLWATFETLLLENGEDRSKISKILSALHSNSDLELLFLENIRLYRNSHVHSGIQDSSPIKYSFRLQNNFIALIDYYLQIEHISLEDANKDLVLASKGKLQLTNELNQTKRVLHRFQELF